MSPLKVLAGYLPAEETGEAQNRFIDGILPNSSFARRPECLVLNLLALEGHASAPHYD
jgi:hypothetical protein